MHPPDLQLRTFAALAAATIGAASAACSAFVTLLSGEGCIYGGCRMVLASQ